MENASKIMKYSGFEYRTWKCEQFSLFIYLVDKEFNVIGYRFFHKGEEIFSSNYYRYSRRCKWNGNKVLNNLLLSFANRPKEFNFKDFRCYTLKQINWVLEYGEELECLTFSRRSSCR